jgi:hypothetical protein
MKTYKITDDKTIKTSEIMAKMKAKFPIWSYWDDEKLDNEFPAPIQTTTREFMGNQEPDPETLGMSVREAEAKGHTNSITVRE